MEPNNKPWAIISGNINGLYNSRNKHKAGLLHDLANEVNAGIILLTETHLNEEIKDAEIDIAGFDIYRSDRQGFKNGGVLMYMKSSLNLGTKQLYSLSHNKVDMIIVECIKINSILVCLYRPPSTD